MTNLHPGPGFSDVGQRFDIPGDVNVGAPLDLDDDQVRETVALFGGRDILGGDIRSRLDAHHLLARGLPGAALRHLVETTPFLKTEEVFEKAVGMSLRTFQRHRQAPDKPLSVEQSGRAWDFATLFGTAKAVFGSEQDAQRWFETPAIGLDQNSPLDLVSTPAGKRLVTDLLGRMEYGVYT